MIQPQNNLSLLDILTIISFIIGWANYEENVDQSDLQEILQKAVNNIHEHLEIQDIKLNKIMGVLNIDT